MHSQRGVAYATGLVLVTSQLLAVGCGTEELEAPPTAESEAGLSTENQLSANQLSANQLSANQLSANQLSANQLSANSLELNTDGSGGLEQTEGGRQVLKYVARCALPSGINLVVTVRGVQYSFPGLLGVAPQWLDRALTTDERELVSACLLAHCNAFGISVPISVRSPGTVLSSGLIEDVQYFSAEGAFYGDVLDGRFETFACLTDPKLVAFLTSPRYRPKRACADEVFNTGYSLCGFRVTGTCALVCRRSSAYGYSDCLAPNGRRYSRVVNTWIPPL